MFLPTAKYIPPENMAALAAKVASSNSFTKDTKGANQHTPLKSPRSQQELIAAILKNQAITPLEWNLLCRNHALWNHGKVEEVANKVCYLLKSNYRLDTYIAQEFVKAFTHKDKAQYFQPMYKVLTQKKPVGINPRKWRLLYQLNNPKTLKKLCSYEIFEKAGNRPYRLHDLLQDNGIEPTQDLKYHIAKALPQCLPEYSAFQRYELGQANRDYILQRVINALSELGDEHRFLLTEQLTLITSKTPEKLRGEYFQCFARWAIDNYGPNQNPHLWRKLTPKARELLTQMTGGTTYRIFDLIIDLIRKNPSVQGAEATLLLNRKEFWKVYQQHFLSIRLLLPEKTYTGLQEDSTALSKHASLLLDDASPDTEVCIFELEKYFIVEFMRGQGKEGRIFEATKENRDILFNSQLSVSKIRQLSCINKYDHCFLWQHFLSLKLLNLGIKPKGKNKWLKEPSADKLQERNKQLPSWKKSIDKLETCQSF
jgi:hypothetical protein